MTEDRPTFEEFVAGRQRALLRLAMILTGDPHLSEDLCADVIGRVFERWDRLRDIDLLDAYVRRMVINEYLSWRRRARRMLSFAHTDGLGPVLPDPATAHADREDMIGRLAGLSPRQRAAVVLRFYEGMTDGEIAAVMGCRPATVRSHVFRALQALRIDLADADGGSLMGRQRPTEA